MLDIMLNMVVFCIHMYACNTRVQQENSLKIPADEDIQLSTSAELYLLICIHNMNSAACQWLVEQVPQLCILNKDPYPSGWLVQWGIFLHLGFRKMTRLNTQQDVLVLIARHSTGGGLFVPLA